MEKPVFYNDQGVLAEDLDQITNYIFSEVVDRLKSLMTHPGGYGDNSVTGSNLTGGILGNPLNYWNDAVDLKISLLSATSIQVGIGKALDNDGNLISVNTLQTLTINSTGPTYSWEGESGLQYVSIKYTETDTAYKSDLVGALFPTRVTPSFFITVSATPPVYEDGEIILATFNTYSSGEALTSTLLDKRVFATLAVPASGVIINPKNKTTLESHQTLQDHVNAKGTGDVTQKNIHGLALADLGYDENASLLYLINHMTQSHRNGIIHSGTASIPSQNSFLGVLNSPTNNQVAFTPATGAVAFINGKTVSSFSPLVLTGAAAYAIGGDAEYYAVINSSGSVSWKLGSALPAGYFDQFTTGPRISRLYPDELLLGMAIVSDGGADIDWTDYRSWFNLTVDDIAPTDTGAAAAPSTLVMYNSLSNHLAQLRYQIGAALQGPGVPWDSTGYPLTSGPTSNADNYHAHTFDALEDVLSLPAVRVSNLVTLVNGPTSNADDLHTHSSLRKGATLFVPELAWGQDTIPYNRKTQDDSLGLAAVTNKITFGNNSLYVASKAAAKLYKINPFNNVSNVEVAVTEPLLFKRLFYDGSYLYVGALTPSEIRKVNKDTLVEVAKITLSSVQDFISNGVSTLWALDTVGNLIKINSSTMVTQSTTAVPTFVPLNLTYDGENLWMTGTGYQTVKHASNLGGVIVFNTITVAPSGYLVGSNPVFDGTHVWVALFNTLTAAISLAKIDTDTNTFTVTEYTATLSVGDGVSLFDRLYFDGRKLFLGSSAATKFYIIDPQTLTAVEKTITAGVNSITTDGIYTWLALTTGNALHKELSL